MPIVEVDLESPLEREIRQLLAAAFDQLLAVKLLIAAQNPLLTYSIGVLCYNAIMDVLQASARYEQPLAELCTDLHGLIAQVSFLQEVQAWPQALMRLAFYDRTNTSAAAWHIFLTPDWHAAEALTQALAIIDVIADAMPDALHESYCCVLKQKHI